MATKMNSNTHKIIDTMVCRCDNKGCNGGRAFDIKGALFCSPRCGNEYWGLKYGDEDYWSCSEEEEEEEDLAQ